MKEARDLAAAGPPDKRRPLPGKGVTPQNPSRPATSNPAPPDATPFDPITRSLASVRFVRGSAGAPVAGTVTLEIRPPAGPLEREQFPSLDGDVSSYPALPLLVGRNSIAIPELSVSAETATQRQWKWPGGAVGEIVFEAASEIPGPERIAYTSVTLPSHFLIESALEEREISDSFIIAGELEEDGATPRVEGDVLETITAARKMDRTYLLLPSAAFEPLLDTLQRTSDLSVLFSPELIGYESGDEALRSLLGDDAEALSAATESFSEIEAVSARMPLVDLARNAKVQERLELILEDFPRHLSARAMLEFGKRPVPSTMKTAWSLRSAK